MEKHSKKTSGHTKLINFLEQLIRNEPFIKELQIIRKKYDIPYDGFGFLFSSKEEAEIFAFKYPSDWDSSPKNIKSVDNDLDVLTKKFDLGPVENWRDELKFILFYDYVHLKDMMDLSLIDEVGVKGGDSMWNAKTHPIAIRITPYASQRDVINYIKANFNKLVLPIQNKYRSPNMKLGIHRTKGEHNQYIHDFIYDHRDVPAKELVGSVLRIFGVSMDHAHIQKIKDIEKKKRN
jgi:hypothetical protein